MLARSQVKVDWVLSAGEGAPFRRQQILGLTPIGCQVAVRALAVRAQITTCSHAMRSRFELPLRVDDVACHDLLTC